MASQVSASFNLLVADDDDFMQDLLVDMLKDLGHTGLMVSNGKKVIDCLAQRRFDVVMLDMMMPVMDGLEALASIRSQERLSGKHQAVIMVTGHAQSADRERLLQFGADGYVSKPIDPSELHLELCRVMRASQRSQSH